MARSSSRKTSASTVQPKGTTSDSLGSRHERPHARAGVRPRQKFAMTTNRYELQGLSPEGQAGPVLGVAVAEADGAQGGGHLLRRRHQDAEGVQLQGTGRHGPQRRLRRVRRGAPAAGLLPQGLRGQPAAVDVPHRGSGLRRHRPGAQPGGGDPAPVRRHPVPADPLRLRDPRGPAAAEHRAAGHVRDRYTVRVPDPRVDFRIAAAARRRHGRDDGAADGRCLPGGPGGGRGGCGPRSPCGPRATTSRRPGTPTVRSRSRSSPRTSRRSSTSTPTACGSGCSAGGGRPGPAGAPARRRLRLPRPRRARPAVPAAREPARHGGAERRLPAGAGAPVPGRARRRRHGARLARPRGAGRWAAAARRTSTATAPAATSRWWPRCGTPAGSGRWCCTTRSWTRGPASSPTRSARPRPSTRARREWYWQQYAGSAADLTDPDLAPLLSDRLGTLPPTLVTTAEHDPLRDEGEHLAALIAEAGRRRHVHALPRPDPRLLAARAPSRRPSRRSGTPAPSCVPTEDRDGATDRMARMRVHLGSDHAGLDLKAHLTSWLTEHGYEPVDHGPFEYDAVDDYPVFCLRAAEGVATDRMQGLDSLGVVIGGSGNGEQMAANKVPGIRCALAWSEETASLAREHNDAQVVSVGGRMHPIEDMTRFVEVFLTTPFSGDERHVRRIGQIRRLRAHPRAATAAGVRPSGSRHRAGAGAGCLRDTPSTGSPPRSTTPSPVTRSGSAARRAGSRSQRRCSTVARWRPPSRGASTSGSTSRTTTSCTSTSGSTAGSTCSATRPRSRRRSVRCGCGWSRRTPRRAERHGVVRRPARRHRLRAPDPRAARGAGRPARPRPAAPGRRPGPGLAPDQAQPGADRRAAHGPVGGGRDRQRLPGRAALPAPRRPVPAGHQPAGGPLARDVGRPGRR